MKTFLWTFALVAGGIWLYTKLTGKQPITGKITFGALTISTPQANFYGPDVDPITGAYLAPGAAPGTTNFTEQGF
jgi:hypothetical protein